MTNHYGNLLTPWRMLLPVALVLAVLTLPAVRQTRADDQPPRAGPALLLPDENPHRRSEHLEQVARQADRQIRHGFELAGRKAYFAARAEFVGAMRIIAQCLDTEHQTTTHSRSLAAGMAAIKEAGDFMPGGSAMEADLNLPNIIGGHSTPVLKNVRTDSLAPISALQCYLTFAQEQLAAAAGGEVAGSMALHGLGKMHEAMAWQKSTNIRVAEPKAVVFYQAALLVYPKNAIASNDLGVLLARCGRHNEAQTALRHSLSICPQSTGWRNLAGVYQQLGRAEPAQRADRLARSTRRTEDARRKARYGSSNQSVRWVDSKKFAKSYEKNHQRRN